MRSQLRAFAWEQIKRLERAGLGEAIEVSSLRDKLVLQPGHPAATRLTTDPFANGFVRADTGSLLFRNAAPEFIRAVPRVLVQKRMNSMKGLEFRWTQLSEAEILTLADLVLRFAAPRHFEPTADPGEFKAALEALASQPPPLEVPHGQERPEQVAVSRNEFRRCPHVVDWVLGAAQGKCERCRVPAPFLRHDGTPFLEVHHVRRLADGGSDKVTNAVALCPNCHRLLHHSPDAEAAVAGLYQSVPRLVPEAK